MVHVAKGEVICDTTRLPAYMAVSQCTSGGGFGDTNEHTQ